MVQAMAMCQRTVSHCLILCCPRFFTAHVFTNNEMLQFVSFRALMEYFVESLLNIHMNVYILYIYMNVELFVCMLLMFACSSVPNLHLLVLGKLSLDYLNWDPSTRPISSCSLWPLFACELRYKVHTLFVMMWLSLREMQHRSDGIDAIYLINNMYSGWGLNRVQ